MKILFHPSFDSGYYINLSQGSENTLGTKIVGLAGLLDHLSLQNGLSGRFASDGERSAAYLACVEKHAKGSLIENSFITDKLGVAKQVLQWRDQLIMAGWTPTMADTTDTPKLKLLCEIETSWKSQLPGSADRWRNLVELSKSQTLLREGDTIECRCEKKQLPLLAQKVLESCKATFAEYDEDPQIADDLNVDIVHYTDLTDAYRQVAAKPADYADSVIINRDNVTLNHALYAWSQPLIDATIQDSNPLTLQLFKLSMSVFSRPLNIKNILSYLQLPIAPAPRKLRNALAKDLISEGGFGEVDWDELKQKQEYVEALRKANVNSKWDQDKYDYINNDEEDEAELIESVADDADTQEPEEAAKDSESKKRKRKAEREGKVLYLKYITDDSFLNANGKISTEILRKYISDFNKWASPIANSNDEDDLLMKDQLSTVVSYFVQLRDILENKDEISYEELEKHVRTIYQPTTIKQARAQVGSLKVVSDLTQLIDTPASLVWLDCCGSDTTTDKFEFLSSAERQWLNKQTGVTIPSLQDTLDLNRKEMITSLSKIKGGITLVASDYHHNTRMAEHPLIAELKMLRGDAIHVTEGKLDLPQGEEKETINGNQKAELEYTLNKISIANRSESNTSLDTLINYPFDYTVNYIAKLSEPSSKELGAVDVTNGNVAHLFIQDLILSVKDLDDSMKLDKMKDLLEKEYDSRLDAAIKSKGLILLLKENEVDYQNLRFQLKKSVETLIEIMETNKLIPVGSEVKYNKGLSTTIPDFNARLDLELKDKDGRAVIFDFKWTYSNYYGDKIKENTAIQLELYRKVLEKNGKQVAAVGYYLLPKRVLLTASKDFQTQKDGSGKIIVEHIDAPTTNLFNIIDKSVEERKKEIEEGKIEEGEEQDIKDLDYLRRYTATGDILLVGKIKKDGRGADSPIKSITKESKKVFKDEPRARFESNSGNWNNSAQPIEEKATTYPLMKGRLK